MEEAAKVREGRSEPDDGKRREIWTVLVLGSWWPVGECSHRSLWLSLSVLTSYLLEIRRLTRDVIPMHNHGRTLCGGQSIFH